MEKVYRKIVIFFVFPLSIFAFSQNIAAYQDTNGFKEELRVVLGDNFPPYVFKDSDGNLQGILVDQWMLWQEKTGIKVKLYGMDWGLAIKRMKAGDFDVMDTVFYNEELTKYLDFTKTYAEMEVKPLAGYYLYEYEIQDKFYSASSLYVGSLHRAVLKGNTMLLNTIENGFSLISKNEYDDINKKWFVMPEMVSKLVGVFFITILIATAVVVFLLIWNFTLDRKVKEKTAKLYELSALDILTGLYNRNYFDNELDKYHKGDRAGIAMVICDIDGLKLINDTLGHAAGDEYLKMAATILQQCFRKEDVIARIGGDEFAVFMKSTTANEISSINLKIAEMLKKLNSEDRVVPISMSIGYAIGDGKHKDLRELLKIADNLMYREKLHHRQSVKSKNIDILTKMLEVRDFITEGHGERMQELCCKLAEAVGMSENEIKDMSLFAHFHDIGKIGIPDRILFKPGKLTEEEMDEMKRHTEIGYRIAEASPDLMHISDWVLKHHEWWNGSGYPFGLKGEEVPLQCRILTIVDAFDAMTSNRPYRKALPKETAVEEIIKFKGRQFDSILVDKFIELIRAC